MKGTEKQIAYANDLLAKMNAEFNELIKLCPETLKPKWINLFSETNKIASDAYAGDVISVLQDLYDHTYEYYKDFYYRIHGQYTPFTIKMRELFKEIP